MPMHKGLLPREGLYAVPVLKLIARTALNPSLLLPLVLLARYTKRGQDLSILHYKAYGRIKTLLYLGLARTVSRWLSDKVRNNWVNDRYDWSREIVVVTGGASGIGGAMVKLFDELGIKIVVIDIQAMTYATCKSSHSLIISPEITAKFHSLTIPTHSFKSTLLQVRPPLTRQRQRGRRQDPQPGRPPNRPHQQRRCRPRQDCSRCHAR